ncbi:hypothetical protein CDL12_26170 [Handroanthus impetiginosus]|uniref:DUF7804 domain-containing protein n=1 Tax=Handroanthus impetiginosus TaxID=429701 RepID=A0A2G9G7Q4_9LAMI|nr:hypothetical protein CDL12_26170 [Handroanthus impetiginosus]
MASIGVHSGGKLLYPSFNKSNNQVLPSNQFLPIKKSPQKLVSAVSASMASSNSAVISPEKNGVFLEKIDSWMEDSVQDIVKNLKQAPLLVQIFSDSGNGRAKIQTEKAIADKWPIVKNEWRKGATKSPDGLIFVGELEQDLDQENNKNQDFEEGITRAWGVVVQGKGVDLGPACYLLKTTKVCNGMDLGFCTHFCLTRVNNFMDSALEQFTDSWLLQ